MFRSFSYSEVGLGDDWGRAKHRLHLLPNQRLELFDGECHDESLLWIVHVASMRRAPRRGATGAAMDAAGLTALAYQSFAFDFLARQFADYSHLFFG